MKPYYADETVQLYLGDMREVLPALGLTADCVVADPPYGETSLPWDRWPDGWLDVAAIFTSSLWCFGSLRMLLRRRDEFASAGWKLSQDVVWRKQQGTGFSADRFRRVHEAVAHWYRGDWRGIHHVAVRVPYSGPGSRHGHHGGDNHVGHMGAIQNKPWVEDGTRLASSVFEVRNMHRRGALHPTEKPVDLLRPLIEYACPVGGLIVDPFAGSAATLVAARLSGRRAIGIEANEQYAERAAKRLAQTTLEVS